MIYFKDLTKEEKKTFKKKCYGSGGGYIPEWVNFYRKKELEEEEYYYILNRSEEQKKADRKAYKKEHGFIAQARESGKIKCPYCRSENVQFMQNNRKGFSVGKAVAGTVLVGGVGAVAGFAGKKGKNQWFCTDCNRTFQTKK